MTLAEMLRHRRSVQHDDAQKPLDSDKVRECLKLAQPAPGSPNMQLYGFYRITGRIRAGQACRSLLGAGRRNHRTTDGGVCYPSGLYRARAQAAPGFERGNIGRNSPPEKTAGRLKKSAAYYGKPMPFVYTCCFGLMGMLRKLIAGTACSVRLPATCPKRYAHRGT
ncbi:hypothetical protein [Neisseria musculi]|uniref:NAD(P)H-flavin oxidoreductase n=1 Tax=Neisseria musculi TaxID=1815583 RepID=A0A7H1M8F4_9NEIS|nr:hypothetical protein [Neisseria musculi]QNT57919.1 putative nAD(P)H-flavin oxidoreductase [Neisseria musculi]